MQKYVILLFHDKNVFVNAPQSNVIRTLPVWFLPLVTFSFLVQILQALYSGTLQMFYTRIKCINVVIIISDELHGFNSFCVVKLKEHSLPLWRNSPTRAGTAFFLSFLDHTPWHITVNRTPLDKWSAGRRDLQLTTRNTHKTQTSMAPAGFELTIPASDWPQILVLDPSATGIGIERSSLYTVPKTNVNP
jgi:hypothetical protein